MMRTLAIDLGERRVGLAMSDESGRWATPHEVLTVSSPEAALGPITRLIEQEGVRRIIIGLPLNMDGTAGPAARKTLGWGGKLHDRCGLAIVYVDERLSSFDAEQRLIERKRAGEKLTRRRKKEQLDAVAAAGFLQAYLDGKLPALSL